MRYFHYISQIVIFALVAGPAWAESNDHLALRAIKMASDEWHSCVLATLGNVAETIKDPNRIIESTFAACQTEETSIRMVVGAILAPADVQTQVHLMKLNKKRELVSAFTQSGWQAR